MRLFVIELSGSGVGQAEGIIEASTSQESFMGSALDDPSVIDNADEIAFLHCCAAVTHEYEGAFTFEGTQSVPDNPRNSDSRDEKSISA